MNDVVRGVAFFFVVACICTASQVPLLAVCEGAPAILTPLSMIWQGAKLLAMD